MLWFKFFFVFALLLCLMEPCFVEAQRGGPKRGLHRIRRVGFLMLFLTDVPEGSVYYVLYFVYGSPLCAPLYISFRPINEGGN